MKHLVREGVIVTVNEGSNWIRDWTLCGLGRVTVTGDAPLETFPARWVK